MQEIMNATDIAFPHLGIYLKNVPQGFSVFGFPIALYGVVIALGVLSGLLLAVRMAKKTGQNPDDYWDFSIYAIIFSIIGARIYFVIFSWELYKDSLLDIFNTRKGGMAIYGGVIAAFLTLFIYCKLKHKNPLQMGDTAVPGLVIGQIIGRWGNFFNREVFGEYTDNFLAMRLPVEAVRRSDISETIAANIVEGTNYIQVHPTFLYESLWNVLVLVLMLLFFKHKKFHGEICLLYFAGYGLGRFIIEGIRTDQLLIGNSGIPVSQLLSLLMIFFAIVIFIFVRIQIKRGKSYKLLKIEKD